MHEHVDTIEFVINSWVQDITVSKIFRPLTLGVRNVVCLWECQPDWAYAVVVLKDTATVIAHVVRKISAACFLFCEDNS